MGSELWLADPFGADFLGCVLLGLLDMGWMVRHSAVNLSSDTH
jgi:hypothetical protein